jgi:hypothetical protein
MTSFYVYEHIRKDTGEVFYVGKGSKDRFKVKQGRNPYWNNVVNKSNGFIPKILINVDNEELAYLCESERIDQLKRLGCLLTNLNEGGEGSYKPSDETRAKMSASRQGEKNPRFNINSRRQKYARKEFVSDEIKSANMKKNHWSKTGSYVPPSGTKYSEERKQKLRGCRESVAGGKNPKAKSIFYDGKEFLCIKDFASYLNVAYKTLVVKIRVVGRTVFTVEDYESLTNGRIAFN